MKKIQIKENQLLFLERITKNYNINKILKKTLQTGPIYLKSNRTKTYTLNISCEEIEIILDKLTEALTERGIDKNFEANKIGLKIEDLIDLFNNAIQQH